MWFNNTRNQKIGGDQIEVFKILNGYEKLTEIFCSQSRKREGLEDMELQ